MSIESTRTGLFGIFVVADRPLTAIEVIELAAPLGISRTNVKSHLTRLVKEGALESTGPVRQRRYRPSRSQSVVIAGIAERLQRDTSEPWNGDWLVLCLSMPRARARRDALRTSLWFHGFRPITPDAFVRPAWPAERVGRFIRSHLAEAGGICVRGQTLGGMDERTVSALYQLDVLDREALRLAEWVRRQTKLEKQSVAAAFAARLEVGGYVARFVGHDPVLPAALWGRRDGIAKLRRAYQRFEERMAPAAELFLAQVVEPKGSRSESQERKLRVRKK